MTNNPMRKIGDRIHMRKLGDRIHKYSVVTGKDTKIDITTELIIEFINKEDIRELFTDFIGTKLDKDLII